MTTGEPQMPHLLAPFVDLLHALLMDEDEQFESLLNVLKASMPCFNAEETYMVGQTESLSSMASQFSDVRCYEAFRLLCYCPALAAVPRLSDGFYPLHIAAMIGDFMLSRGIAMAFPAAVVAQNAKGKTPLHFASREGNTEIVKLILQIEPNSARIASTDRKKIPLHFAADEGFVDICKLLLAAYPEGAAQKTSKQKLPLHFASRKGATDTVKLLLSTFPEACKLLDWECSPPLHVAIREGREDAAKNLIEQCPDALRVRNMSGELPLDIAVGISSLALLSQMIHAWPGACTHVLQNVKHANDFQRWSWVKIELLLLGASGTIKGNISGEVSEGFLDSEESSVHSNTESKPQDCCLCDKINEVPQTEIPPAFQPLHVALRHSNSTDFMRSVFEKCPDLVKCQDVEGCYPLHVIASRGDLPMSEIGVLMLKANPEAAQKRDSQGMLPLHIALCKNPDVTFIRELLRVNPISGVQKCKMKNKKFRDEHPLVFAVTHGCCMDILYMVIRSDPSLAKSIGL